MMDAKFPADGQIHVRRKGKISITPKSLVCQIWFEMPESERTRYFGINGGDLFDPLGQSSARLEGGGGRQVSVRDPGCQDPASVIAFGEKSENRNGKPYRIVLAFWQGDPATDGAMWIGGIEREANNLHRKAKLLASYDGIQEVPEALRINTSFLADVQDLTVKFGSVVGEHRNEQH